ncbi:hypothetical protein DPMN_096537 [Dreissena polymorpha]|uniref:Uncharacterized protein n=1 Tax=Dreissena polymorpha TaxID=45954 RepID=A0A9D4L9Y1_DREPO|nr:hypothetical protein DPMN_096537 [Dreissena polymorpha]
MPVASRPISVPYSMLKNWELREHRCIGLANQIDLMAATILEMACELLDSVPEELCDLLIHLSRMTQFLCSPKIFGEHIVASLKFLPYFRTFFLPSHFCYRFS